MISLTVRYTVTMPHQSSFANQNLNTINRCRFDVYEHVVLNLLKCFQALQIAQVMDPTKCLFVDDNLQNVQAAKKLGWGSCVYFREKNLIEEQRDDGVPVEGVDAIIEKLDELRVVWKYIFKK